MPGRRSKNGPSTASALPGEPTSGTRARERADDGLLRRLHGLRPGPARRDDRPSRRRGPASGLPGYPSRNRRSGGTSRAWARRRITLMLGAAEPSSVRYIVSRLIPASPARSSWEIWRVSRRFRIRRPTCCLCWRTHTGWSEGTRQRLRASDPMSAADLPQIGSGMGGYGKVQKRLRLQLFEHAVTPRVRVWPSQSDVCQRRRRAHPTSANRTTGPCCTCLLYTSDAADE